MTRVKICGITNIDDARAAINSGADALGFIGVPDSPRYIFPSVMDSIVRALPPFVSTVSVVRKIHNSAPYNAQYVQYYTAHEDQGTVRPAENRLIRCFRIRDTASLEELRVFTGPAIAVHLDTYSQGVLGGSGERFDWNLALDAKRLTSLPIILAGGLTPENVGEAVRLVRPYAVDVSTGVEIAPGIKDHKKLRDFIAAVRDASQTPFDYPNSTLAAKFDISRPL